MSEAIKCDRCGKLDGLMNCSSLKRADLNYCDFFKKGTFQSEVDLCASCTKELLDFIRNWCKDIRKKFL